MTKCALSANMSPSPKKTADASASEGKSLTLWLIPSSPEFEGLKTIIYQNQLQVKESIFIPHITLLTGIKAVPDLSDKIQGLADSMSRLTLPCQELQKGDDYFHCLFIPVLLSGQLKQLRDSAEHLFSASRPHPFQPHVSLIYSDPLSRDVYKLAKSLPDFSKWDLSISRLELWDTHGPVDRWNSHFRAELPKEKS